MAKYTIELGTLIDSGYDIGLKDYPIPSFADENWRTRLNNKIIAHYRRSATNTKRYILYLLRSLP